MLLLLLPPGVPNPATAACALRRTAAVVAGLPGRGGPKWPLLPLRPPLPPPSLLPPLQPWTRCCLRPWACRASYAPTGRSPRCCCTPRPPPTPPHPLPPAPRAPALDPGQDPCLDPLDPDPHLAPCIARPPRLPLPPTQATCLPAAAAGVSCVTWMSRASSAACCLPVATYRSPTCTARAPGRWTAGGQGSGQYRGQPQGSGRFKCCT